MKLKELVEIMSTEKIVQFRFIPFDGEDPRPRFHFISTEKWNAYKNGNIDKHIDYYNGDDDIFIYMPDVTEQELFAYVMQTGAQYISDAIKQISYIFKVANEERVRVYAIYAILHEMGHYLFFKNSHMTSIEYGDWEVEYRIPALAFNEYLKSDDTARMLYMPRLIEMYKSIPSEIEADKYAFSTIEEKYGLVKNALMDQSTKI